jgi:hypothetical protein
MAYVRSDLEKIKEAVIDNYNQCSGQHKTQLDDI